MTAAWEPGEAFVAWAPDDLRRQAEVAAHVVAQGGFLEQLGAETLPVVLEVLEFSVNRTAAMPATERAARLPRERARVIFESAGSYLVRFLFDGVPPEHVAGLAEALAWLALISRGSEGADARV